MACVTLDKNNVTQSAFTYAATSTQRTGMFIKRDGGPYVEFYALQKNDGANDIFALAWAEPKPPGTGTITTAWAGERTSGD